MVSSHVSQLTGKGGHLSQPDESGPSEPKNPVPTAVPESKDPASEPDFAAPTESQLLEEDQITEPAWATDEAPTEPSADRHGETPPAPPKPGMLAPPAKERNADVAVLQRVVPVVVVALVFLMVIWFVKG